ncbi:LOW QUALITY PROTEIN: probable vacuolar amino acid transporter YPQ1 [Diospyros lotus]|uniref:LOW QUALITY PROTEIN: probable vacuolar amino acid transporter YPQ1 n=1 Tax=Diospyros lotus TaxID=55363 RepID=UPI0022587E86|nr:LOW QUALITY PROTEIN: probable vacuolar amino acid transporter YPQ1 [Diospyros lotus]
MKLLPDQCPNRGKNEGCVRWVEEYFKDCLCNLTDEISFGLGLASLVCWGVAEIPQIITNFHNKSGHGLSLAFLFTWIIGDIFNLMGCVLEPATLPTQFYTALLYTTITVMLALQCIYYDHFLRWWNCNCRNVVEVKDETKEPLKSNSIYRSRPQRNSPVQQVPHRTKFYYASARSLAGSNTPSLQSFIKARSGPSAFEEVHSDSSSEDEAINPPPSKNKSQPWRIPRSVGYGTFLAASANLPSQSRAALVLTGAYIKLSGRKLLQEEGGFEGNEWGQGLGWLMAAIYMGGRIPQIWLNVKRGSVEGLNPLMFILALVANATYTGSILVRSTEWKKIKANMPWLLDAVACVGLDLFIILQYVYYKYMHQAREEGSLDGEDYGGYYVDANK